MVAETLTLRWTDNEFSFVFLARLEGFEPTTLGSEDRCSIH